MKMKCPHCQAKLEVENTARHDTCPLCNTSFDIPQKNQRNKMSVWIITGALLLLLIAGLGIFFFISDRGKSKTITVSAATRPVIASASKPANIHSTTEPLPKPTPHKFVSHVPPKVDYVAYLAKTKTFMESLNRLVSDLDIGLNLKDYTARLRDTNYEFDKLQDTITPDESTLHSWTWMRLAFLRFRYGKDCWDHEIESLDSPDSRALWDRAMHEAWAKANVYVDLSKLATKNKDELEFPIPCPFCKGKTMVSCVLCGGKGDCEFCNNKREVECIDCNGKGQIEK